MISESGFVNVSLETIPFIETFESLLRLIFLDGKQLIRCEQSDRGRYLFCIQDLVISYFSEQAEVA
ncbi:hypothetical protein IFM47457_05974 [Aspergillus lentulus]|nr:hypothetical protein IFM47457_05974 [Aspergillus lentulus]